MRAKAFQEVKVYSSTSVPLEYVVAFGLGLGRPGFQAGIPKKRIVDQNNFLSNYDKVVHRPAGKSARKVQCTY